MKQILSAILLCMAVLVQAQPALDNLTPILTLSHVQVLSSAEAQQWAVVTRGADPVVLAYGESALQAEDLSPEFTWLVEEYDAAAAAEGTSAFRAPRRKATYKDIPTLLTCHWAQDDPFNRHCPSFSGSTSHTKTGCVATAMAQVLYYHKLPTRLHGTVSYSYTSSEGLKGSDGTTTIRISDNLANYVIDWANLIDSPWNRYTGTAACTAEQGEAVSTLMYVCGLATKMQYGYKGSGAHVDWATEGINTYFDGLKAAHVSFDESVILDELTQGNPVIYSGGGHCFVIDGATAAGYLHCNLGWGGGGEVDDNGNVGNPDGYYLPTVMAGYTNGKSIVRVWKDGTAEPWDPSNPGQTLLKFNPAANYTLRNTGYSMGYLVAISATDEHPTLRGVTKDHANGLYKGAAYHDAADLTSPGAMWTITTEGSLYYLKNKLTGKYLTNAGKQTPYVFTSTKTPINIQKLADGTFAFNAGTDAKSYLCAATHLQNPAAFWESSDEGSSWAVQEVVLPDAVSSITISQTSLSLTQGATQQLTATTVPAQVSSSSIEWSSSDTNVATISPSGLVTAVAAGNATISVISVTNPTVRATCQVRVKGSIRVDQLSDIDPEACYIITHRNSGAVLLALTSTDEHPTVRSTSRSYEGGQESYYADADLTSPYSYWQIIRGTSSPWYALYNIGSRKYLRFDGQGYSFTSEPTNLYLVRKEAEAFTINWGEGLTNSGTSDYLYLNLSLTNPASRAGGGVGGRNRYWGFSQVEGVTLQQLLGTEGIAPLAAPAEDCRHAALYDLQGRQLNPSTLHSPSMPAGLYIHQGKKLLRP